MTQPVVSGLIYSYLPPDSRMSFAALVGLSISAKSWSQTAPGFREMHRKAPSLSHQQRRRARADLRCCRRGGGIRGNERGHLHDCERRGRDEYGAGWYLVGKENFA